MEHELISMEEYIPETVRPIEVITAEIQLYKQQAGVAILEIGRRLNEAKAQLGHGEWEPWLKEKAEFSEATARRFMRLAREYENQSLVTGLGASKALILLALPSSERDEFIEETHLVNGEEKTVFDMSKRELEAAVKEREEARARVIELEAEAVKITEQKLELEDRCAAAEAAMAELRSELNEERNRPQEVVVEYVTDAEEIKKAADAAEKKVKAAYETKLKEAERNRKDAEQKLQKWEQEQKNRTTQSEQEKAALTEQLEGMRRQLAETSSAEIGLFKLHFEQVQNGINQMSEIIAKLGQSDEAEKLGNALCALLSAALTAIQGVSYAEAEAEV